mmetsp:Transcript_86988/g.266302  ORF Transcript_86988/g.266302 Transcript_86988/m.266302 type:complete len:207 (-) Transcript_86988:1322-1942(-)
MNCWNSVGCRSRSSSSLCTKISRLTSTSSWAVYVSSIFLSTPAYESQRTCSSIFLLPAFWTWNRNFCSETLSVSRTRSKATILLADALAVVAPSTRNSHHSSNFGSGKKGACTGPAASSFRKFLRVIRTDTVATSPTTISSSSSTSTMAFTSMSLMWATKASMSASCWGSIFARPFRCSGSLPTKFSKVDTAFLPRWQCRKISSSK